MSADTWLGMPPGIVCGWYAHRYWTLRKYKRINIANCEPQINSQKYGHPHAPLPYLMRQVPTAPWGYAWEAMVKHDAEGTPFMHLGLMDVAKGELVAEKKKDLINREYWTWAEHYRKYCVMGMDRDTFRNDLIGPMVDWANNQVNKFSRANDVDEYKL